MLCPVCKTIELVMADRQGIEIDYCPSCRGVWLDRGELDKIVERTIQSDRSAPSVGASYPSQGWGHGGHEGHHDNRRHDEHGHHGQRRSFWKDLFD